MLERTRTWEELSDTGEGLRGAGEVRSHHKCTRSREDEVRRKRHIYYRTSRAGGVVRCGSTKAIHTASERIVGGMGYKRRRGNTAPV